MKTTEEMRAEEESRQQQSREATADKIVRLANEIAYRWEELWQEKGGLSVSDDQAFELRMASLRSAATYVATEDWYEAPCD